jgi:hypothetical protein
LRAALISEEPSLGLKACESAKRRLGCPAY